MGSFASRYGKGCWARVGKNATAHTVASAAAAASADRILPKDFIEASERPEKIDLKENGDACNLKNEWYYSTTR
jgi:hypothetical protein